MSLYDTPHKKRFQHASEYKHLYSTRKWRRISLERRRIEPFCRFCGQPAQVADHITPHKGDEKLFYDIGNTMSLCYSCHNSAKYRIEMGQVPGKDFVINNKASDRGLPTSKNHPWNKE